MLTILLLLALYVLVAGAIYLIQRKHTHSLNSREVFVAVAAKILIGCLYGFIFKMYYEGDDTWQLNQASIKETELLLRDPRQFFYEFTPLSAYSYGGNSFRTVSLFFNDLEYCLLAKFIGIANLVTTGNYYLNVTVFSFISFWGHWWTYRFFCNVYPEQKKVLFYFIFFFPPALFWLSGIRSDAYLFFFSGLLLFSMQQFMERNSVWKGFLILASLTGLAVFRSAFVAAFLPAIIAWYFAARSSRKALLYIVIYFVAVIFFFLTNYFNEQGLPATFASKQHEFLQLTGTRFYLPALTQDAKSYLQVIPYAILNTFLRPAIWEWKGPLQLLASLQVIFFWFMIIWAFVRNCGGNCRSHSQSTSVLSVLFASVCLYVIIGILVPFPGAIIRYKAIPELLILSFVVVALIRTEKSLKF